MKKNIIIAVLAAALVATGAAFGVTASKLKKEAASNKMAADFKQMSWDGLLVSWERCIAKMQISADAAFFGDSITELSDFQLFFPDKKIVELGFAGDWVNGMWKRVKTVSAVNPKKLFIMGGINDLYASEPQQVAERFDSLLTSLAKEVPQTTIYVQSILPVSHEKEDFYSPNWEIAETNKLIEKVADDHGCTFVDLFSLYLENDVLPDSLTFDGVHLTPKGYTRWANRIAEYINE